MSVINNTQRPESTLNKKSNSICYNGMCASVDMGESIKAHISTNENNADLATNILYCGKRKHVVRNILYNIYDYEY